MDQLTASQPARPVILCLSKAGLAIARRLAEVIDADIHGHAVRCPDAPHHFGKATPHIADLFCSGRPVIGICAAGILIRAVAPHLRHKGTDAPVIAVAESGNVAVPLVGGHHGAITLARQVADAVGANHAITTAGDDRWGIPLDEPPAGWRLANQAAAQRVMPQLLAGDGAFIDGDCLDGLNEWFDRVPRGNAVSLTVTRRQRTPGESELVYCPQDVMLGVLAAMLDVPLRIFDRETLAAEAPRLASPSAVVEEEIGIPGVAEAAALAAAGPDGKLIHKKVKSANATMALALAPAPVDEPALAGRKPGRVMLIGIGPGQAEWRTPEASQMILGADELVGYDLYIDLLGAVAAHIPRRDFKLGEEEARCRYALEAAAAGKDVAVICSGDAGIYAMGALVYELLDRDEADGGVSDAGRRVQVVSAPGISALQAAAARSGAILGHDFCAISLSDLLTPWEAIEKRIHAAGVGDFVVAFYNPVSKRRRTQLAAAREILMQYRGGDVPVILASSLGRPDEKIQYRTLGGLDIDEVDMLTTVMVGASSSKRLDLGRGSAVYTPRGYAKHLDAPQGRKQDETEADT